jgi:GNAT superfamily N-acetyltransferase
MSINKVTMRSANIADLNAINDVVERAIMTWNLPERVKRLALSSYHYTEHDLQSLELAAAENDQHQIIGIAAWEPADPKDTPLGQNALLLHGIYVDPECLHQGIGSQLLLAAEQAAINRHYAGLLVKAQASAAGFFLARGMQPLDIKDARRDYAHRYWKQLKC